MKENFVVSLACVWQGRGKGGKKIFIWINFLLYIYYIKRKNLLEKIELRGAIVDSI